ncbi:MAG: transglutaminase family protein [Chitinophagaceae bacterium]
MLYKITHTTNYIYNEPVSICHNIARLIPRSFDKQLCKKSAVSITPQPGVIDEFEDFFGNRVMYFAIQQEHKKLTVTVTSEVEKMNSGSPEINLYTDVPWQDVKELAKQSTAAWLDVHQYIPETIFTTATSEISAYALQSYTPGRPMYEASYHLMQRIYQDFEFTPGFTTVSTPISEVMKARKGVCQDFAHLAIACVRSVGLPARYISGYLETMAPPGKEKLAGADASHAWFSVYIPYMGWVDFDPTNNQLPGPQHITACWGRDYADIAPLKGVIINSGPHLLSVSVDVKRLI